MNHLRMPKLKLGGKDSNVSVAEVSEIAAETSNAINRNNNSNNSKDIRKSLLTRLKRFSVLGNKFTRRHVWNMAPSGARDGGKERSVSSNKLAYGKYNMTGINSVEHRIEIGAPILISTTTLDTDRFGISDARLLDIGGGTTKTPSVERTLTSRSSDGDESEFIDACGTPQIQQQLHSEVVTEMDQFATPMHVPLKYPEDPDSEPNMFNFSSLFPSVHPPPILADEPSIRRSCNSCQLHSKSVTNLHRSELRVNLHKSPSLTLGMKLTTPPHMSELYSARKLGLTSSRTKKNLEDKNNSLPIDERTSLQYISQDFDSPIFREFLSKSLTSCRSRSRDQTSINEDENEFKYDLKSVSCNSLNPQNLFVSIHELEEITRQINETEKFNRSIGLEYCTHRDQLRPSERRITLLKNKNQGLFKFNHNKGKIRKGLHGMKNWIGEEGNKLMEVVYQQTPLKRVGQSKLNLNQSSCSASRKSVSPEHFHHYDHERRRKYQRERDHKYDRDFLVSCEAVTDCIKKNVLYSHQLDDDDDLLSHAKRFKDEGQNGFEELRRYIKQCGDFSKELIFVLQERADSELIYSKSLSKLANKLNKAGRDIPGSVADAWRGVATEMESRSDIHRQLAVSLIDELVKPLRLVVDNNHKTRKAVESNVYKAARVLNEWRISEAKSKKVSHTAARENEKLQDAMLDVRIQKSPSLALLHQGPNKQTAEKELKSAEKDCVKLDNKRKKAEEAVKRADVEYYTLCVRAERARVDWEMSILRGSSQLQTSEKQRLANMQAFVQQYVRLISNMNTILAKLSSNLQPQLEDCSVSKDVQVVRNIRRNSEGPSEQLLPDFYCEHTTLAMNRERRKQSLIKLLQLVKSDLERERRSRDGLRVFSQSLNNQEHQNITEKLYHIRSMLTYLEGARLKLHSALLELDHKPRTTHPLAQHILITRDRTGLQESILKVPIWLKNNDKAQHSAACLPANLDAATSLDDDEGFALLQQGQVGTSCANICVANAPSSTGLLKHFNRSKSNIESFSCQQKETSLATTITPIVVPSTSSATAFKSKTSSVDRGQADGGSYQQDSDIDEFSSQDDDYIIDQKQQLVQHIYQNSQDVQSAVMSQTNGSHDNLKTDSFNNTNKSDINQCQILGRYKVLYSYKPKLYDELELNPGDVIEVHAKQDDGWWLGALRNKIGIFPATFVEENV